MLIRFCILQINLFWSSKIFILCVLKNSRVHFWYFIFLASSKLIQRTSEKTYDFNNPLCDNIQEGNWLLEYLINRIANENLRKSLKISSRKVSDLPRAFRSRYQIRYIETISNLLFTAMFSKLPNWMIETSFIRRAAIGTVAVFGYVSGATWPILNPEIGSLSAGLPHFGEGIWRCWGRDTLIALRGCLLLTGRIDEAIG
jgi:glycogen debranching enzyme